MTTPLEDFIVVIRNWLAIDPEIYPDNIVTSWVRMAEEYLSEALRVSNMIQIDWSTMVEGRVELPKDWLELDTVRFYPMGKPMVWSPRNEFYGRVYDLDSRYTIVGNYIILGKVDSDFGVDVEISYYQRIPPLGDETTWLYEYNSRLLTLATLWHASTYSIEDQRAGAWGGTVEQIINNLNNAHKSARHSGSILVAHKQRRSFG